MAITLDTLRAERVTSIHGRRLGLDKDEFLVGPKGQRMAVTNATSDTTGTALPNHGVVNVVTTTNDSWTLSDPVDGCEVHIITGSSSTGIHTILANNAKFISSASSTSPSMTLTGAKGAAHLIGLTTALWKVVASAGTSAVTHVSTA